MSDSSKKEAGASSKTSSLTLIAKLFLRLGVTAFGGPAAHISMMQDEVVRKKKWLTEQEFLDLLSATNMLPGPNSTEMAIHIGYRQAGFAGLLVAGFSFILPAMIMVIVCAALYTRFIEFSHSPLVAHILAGIAPVIIAVIFQAVCGLASTALKERFLVVLGVLALLACFFWINELVILLVSGALSLLWYWQRKERGIPTRTTLVGCSVLISSAAAILIASSAPSVSPHFHSGNVGGSPASLEQILIYFLKIGSILYGSGYVLIAFLQTDLVESLHWLSSTQLLDAVAAGQITPGPVFTAATFIGYLLAGLPGAIIATVGIFLPAFLLVAVTAPIISNLRKSASAVAIVDGINAASLALMAFVDFTLGRQLFRTPLFLVEAVLCAYILLRFKINSVLLIIAGAIFGAVVGYF